MADFLAGHKISDVDRAYWYMDPKDLKNRYLKALPYLSIDQVKVKDIKSDDFKRIEELEKYQEYMNKHLIKTEKIFDIINTYPEIRNLINEKIND